MLSEISDQICLVLSKTDSSFVPMHEEEADVVCYTLERTL